MGKNILVVGGTYFAGRVFAMVTAGKPGYSLTFVNRGRYSMQRFPNVKEFRCDRHDAQGLRELPAEAYDAVVDFCAYEPGDIRTLLTNLAGRIGRYLFISTADVYDRSSFAPKDESAPLQTSMPDIPGGDYMFKKALLETEMREICAEKNIAYTALRPAFLYGPYNYAPRESYYVEKIVKHEPIPVPSDASAEFNFAYVKDLAEAINLCIENESAKNKAYNISAPEVLSYERFMKALEKVSDLPFETYPVTVEQVLKESIPVPFPLRAEESELFIGSRISSELGLRYTPFEEGLKKAYGAFKTVYGGK